MIGAIVGDVLGSIHEKIPGKELRREYQLTDDSFLTLATLDWMNSINFQEFQFLYEKNKRFSSQEYTDLENNLRSLAKNFLIKWFEIGSQSTWQSNEEAIPVFSPGFEAWVLHAKGLVDSSIKHKGNTNGCLMRNSPISYIGVQNNLTLEQILKLSEIFCSITHHHFDSLNAVRIHSAILYKLYSQKISADDLKNQLIKSQKYFFNYHIDIQPLEYWIPTPEKIAHDPSKRFIWDAKNSLDIACSAIYYSNSFKEAIGFCNKTNMDTDTYSAIAGPIAECLWGIDEGSLRIAQNCILQNNQIEDFLSKNFNQFSIV